MRNIYILINYIEYLSGECGFPEQLVESHEQEEQLRNIVCGHYIRVNSFLRGGIS
jgi:hypothetical protein